MSAGDDRASSIVVTVADGTVYEFTDISACDTSATVGPPTRPHGDETTITVEATC